MNKIMFLTVFSLFAWSFPDFCYTINRLNANICFVYNILKLYALQIKIIIFPIVSFYFFLNERKSLDKL